MMTRALLFTWSVFFLEIRAGASFTDVRMTRQFSRKGEVQLLGIQTANNTNTNTNDRRNKPAGGANPDGGTGGAGTPDRANGGRYAGGAGTPDRANGGRDAGRTSRISGNLYPIISVLAILAIWEVLSVCEIVPSFMLPSPMETVQAFIGDFSLLMSHSKVTLIETLVGTLLGIALGFLAACLMDRWEPAYKAMYPLIVLTQTIPAVAIAPLLVLWFGYQMTPKIILIVLITFFPIAIGTLEGFRGADQDAINLMRSMGASRRQIFRHIKFPGALPNFFSGLRITVAYAVVGAVLAEWLGGFAGLGVYMTRVKKSFAYDKMFAVIFLISIISLLLIWLVSVLQKRCMPWEHIDEKKRRSSRWQRSDER